MVAEAAQLNKKIGDIDLSNGIEAVRQILEIREKDSPLESNEYVIWHHLLYTYDF